MGARSPHALAAGVQLPGLRLPWDSGLFPPRHRRLPPGPFGGESPEARGLAGSKVLPLLWGGYRGLFFYAPILVLAIPGWILLARRRQWGMTLVSVATVVAIFLVNLSYPEWTGGWSTGPRLLVPLIPFAMLPVAATLAVGGVRTTWIALRIGGGGCSDAPLPGDPGPCSSIRRRSPLRRRPPALEWSQAPSVVGEYGRFATNLVGLLIPGPLSQLPREMAGGYCGSDRCSTDPEAIASGGPEHPLPLSGVGSGPGWVRHHHSPRGDGSAPKREDGVGEVGDELRARKSDPLEEHRTLPPHVVRPHPAASAYFTRRGGTTVDHPSG